MGALTEKQMTILSAIGGVVIAGVFGFLSYLEYGKIDEQRTQVAAEKKKLTDFEAKIKKIPETRDEIKQLQETFVLYRKTLPTGPEEINRFYDQFAAWREKLEIGPITYSVSMDQQPAIWPKQEEPAAQAAPAAKAPAARRPAARGKAAAAAKSWIEEQRFLSFSCNFWQLGQFLNFIENWDRLAIVTDLKLSTGSKREYGDVELKVGFGVKTFYFKGSEIPLGADNKPIVELPPVEDKPIPPDLRDQVFGKRYLWEVKGSDDWGKDGQLAFNKDLARNPFDPYPALTIDDGGEMEAVEKLERRLDELKVMIQEKKESRTRLLELLSRLRQESETPPSTPQAKQRWEALRTALNDAESAVAGPDQQRQIDMAYIGRLQQRITQVREALKEKNYELANRYLRNLIEQSQPEPKTPEAKSEWQKIRTELPKLQDQVAAHFGDAAVAKAQSLLREAKEAFDAEEYGKVSTLTRDVEGMAGKFEGNVQLAQVAEEARELKRRADRRLELSRFQIQITGVVHYRRGGRDFALINRGRYAVGDVMQFGDKQVRVIAIEAGESERMMQVIFEYEGERFSRTRSTEQS